MAERDRPADDAAEQEGCVGSVGCLTTRCTKEATMLTPRTMQEPTLMPCEEWLQAGMDREDDVDVDSDEDEGDV